jgi:tetratricopeptide (TPR) repeat protein
VNLLVLRSTVYDFMRNHDAVISDLTLVFELCHRYPQRFGRRYQGQMAEYYQYRGWHYFLKGAYSEALADFDEAIRRKADVFDWYIIRARARYLLGDKTGTVADAQQALGLADNVTYRTTAQFILDTIANDSPW